MRVVCVCVCSIIIISAMCVSVDHVETSLCRSHSNRWEHKTAFLRHRPNSIWQLLNISPFVVGLYAAKIPFSQKSRSSTILFYIRRGPVQALKFSAIIIYTFPTRSNKRSFLCVNTIIQAKFRCIFNLQKYFSRWKWHPPQKHKSTHNHTCLQ